MSASWASSREQVGGMRRDVAADLEHDLRVMRQHEPPRIAGETPAADEHGNAAREREQAHRFEPSAPHTEEVAEREGSRLQDFDDSGRSVRPQRVAATAARDADPGRDDDD